MRLTYAQIKENVGRAIGVCADDPQLLQLVNESAELLWNGTDWVGKYIAYRLRVTGDCNGSRCIIWPREIETIEGISICGQPLGIRNQWFEYMEDGPGNLDYNCARGLLGDRQEVCTLEEIKDFRSKIKVYADVDEADDAQILILGYDENSNWIRTQVDGVWVDGEYVPINATTPTVSVNFFSKVTGVQKPETNGTVRLYSMNVDTTTLTTIGIYEYDETIPVYRRSVLTGIFCSDCQCVRVMGKRRRIPIQVDTDYVYPALLSAHQVALIAIKKRDNMNTQEYLYNLSEAKRLLAEQAKGYAGNGAYRPLKFIKKGAWTARRNIQ